MMQPQGGVDLPKRFGDEMGARLGPDFPREVGLAVSGGGDSMAMLHLALPWARVMGIGLRVATVDHGLRDTSAAEAALVSRTCAEFGLPHATLRWGGWTGQGNLQGKARDARLALLDGWRGELSHILFAHTQDDQAETVLMRLARGSGVEGLAGIPACQRVQGQRGTWHLLRPLLGTSRAELRHYNKVLHVPYVDDPSNDDTRFDRVKARQALDALEGLGLTRKGLAQTASRMARAKDALEARAASAASCVRATRYEVVFDRDGFAALERDTQLRLMARALQSIASNPYRPRASALDALLDRALAGGDGVLHGGQVLVRRDAIWVIREAKALAEQSTKIAGITTWDRRFEVSGQHIAGATLRALGPDGVAQLPARPQDIPAQALHVTPAVFKGEVLLGCFRLGYGVAYTEEHRPNPVMFGAHNTRI